MTTALQSASPPEPGGDGEITPLPFANSSKKVLVIDDTADVRFIIAETLNVFGFTAIVAEDGMAGVRLAQEQIPDLIICDINMPNMDGYATLIAMRQHDATATIPFIFLSGATDKINMRKGMELGADDYLTKPFTHKELLAAVNTRLEKQAEVQRQSDKKLDELRGNITLALPHELHTPLNGILGLAGIMIEDHATMPPAEVLESALFIQESAHRLHRLIENFLVFSQLELMASEAKKIQMASALAPTQAQEILPDLARKVAARFKREADLQLRVTPASLLIPPENLSKIAEELMDNAFKFSSAGQPVRVDCGIVNRLFQLSVADQGRGLTAEQISKIAPHTQFDRKTYEQQGSGLGLTIAKRLTELLGGRMAIDSKPGAGTTIRILFETPGR